MRLEQEYSKELIRRKLNSEKLEDREKADPSAGFFYRLVTLFEIKALCRCVSVANRFFDSLPQ
jgi:hypothetical protein